MSAYIFRAGMLCVILTACVVDSAQAQHFKKSGRKATAVSGKHWWNSKKQQTRTYRCSVNQQQKITVTESVEPQGKPKAAVAQDSVNVPPAPQPNVKQVAKPQLIKQAIGFARPIKQAIGIARMPAQTRQAAGYVKVPSVRLILQTSTTPPVPIGLRYQQPTTPITSIGGINNNGTGSVQLDAPMYPCLLPNIPYQVGGSMMTNQAFAPHEMLYAHKYKAVYPPFYYKVHGKWMVTPFGVWSHDTWVLEGTEVEVNYKSKLGSLSSKLGVFSGFSQPGRY